MKRDKKDILKENIAKGKAGEEEVKEMYELQDYEVKKAFRGKDFIMEKRDLIEDKIIETKHIEVKTGKSKLSNLQKKTKKGNKNYKVERINPAFR